MAVDYDFIMDHIKEEMLIDASMFYYAKIQFRFDIQELSRKGKNMLTELGMESKRPGGSFSRHIGFAA